MDANFLGNSFLFQAKLLELAFSLIAKFDIEIADDEYETQTGLMNRKSMKNDNAMLFIFPDMQMRAFYMKNTLIPLDIIYLDNNNTIVSIIYIRAF